FSDALSGADGTGDPAVMMPVLDVYPDALSAPMPSLEAGPIPIVTALSAPATGQVVAAPAVAVRPARSTQSGGRVPPAARGQATSTRSGRPAQPTQPSQPLRPTQPTRPVPQPRVAPAGSPQAIRPAAPSPANASSALRNLSDRIGTWSYQGKIAQSDAYWNARQQVAPQSTRPAPPQRAVVPAQRPANSQRAVATQQYRPAPARTSAQSQASASPTEVAPAAPTASQYGQMREIRNQSQLRRAARSPRQARKARGQSVFSVLVFIVIVLFATGVGQRIIDAVTALIQR
ncbi:MAG: hypothetical protein ABI780_15000, partial [Ardenticatenales bacterium]